MERIYADNAATTAMSRAAMDAMTAAMALYGNPSSLHQEGQRAAKALEDARYVMADALGCRPGEIIFTSGGSEADNQALRSAAAEGKRRGRRHIISTAVEHHAVLRTLEELADEGFDVTLLPVDENGRVSAGDAAAAIREDTCLVSVMTANNEVGTIQPAAEIAALCRVRHIPFHTDAVQAAGHLSLRVDELGVDMLSLSAHKFHGPKGVGALYVRRGTPVTPVIFGGAQERGRRAGTENLPAIAGMAAALRESVEHMERDRAHVTALRDRLAAGLLRIPHAVLNGGGAERLPGIVNLSFECVEGEPLVLLLDARGIAASSGSACASGSHTASHVIRALGRSDALALGSVRLSLCESNTADEVDRIIAAVTESVAYLRSLSPEWKAREAGETPWELL